jgi:hypothetical protein
LRTIPFSQISGALNAKFGRDDFKAVGCLSGNSTFNTISSMIYSPRDRYVSSSKVPLQVEFLSNVSALVFVKQDSATDFLPDHFDIFLGGLKSRGFGECHLEKSRIVDGSKVKPGKLKFRIPCDEMVSFNIKKVIKPVYGYLFKPLPETFTGEYVLSLFEDTEVVAPNFMLKEENRG